MSAVVPAQTEDMHWMERALVNASRGLGRTTPNPVVGACVVTSDGVVVGDGSHERAGEPHAEVYALDEAGARARGATLYCTLEPCAHTGRTGPCTERIIAAGIARVVAAMEDPFPLVRGRGFQALREHGIAVQTGVCEAAAQRLNMPFCTSVLKGRPFIILKAAASQDGRLAAAAGERIQLTSGQASRHAHSMRAQVDAIAVGSGTVLADDPLLTCRHVYRERALIRVIFDRTLRLPRHARVLQTTVDGPVLVITSSAALQHDAARARALEQAGATLLPVDDPTLLAAIREAARHGVQSVVLEGGALVHQAAWDEGIVDYVQLYVAPVTLGGNGARLAGPRGSILGALSPSSTRQLGPDVLLEGYVHRPH